MDIRTLRSFAVLAEERHFTRAASRLHVAQPALTKQIQQLEQELGCRLFERGRAGVSLTPDGAVLLRDSQRVLEAARQVTATAAQLRQGERGVVRVGFTPTAPHHVLPRLLREFRRRHAGAELSLLEASSAEQIDLLARGELDVGVLRPPSGTLPDGIVATTFHHEPFVAALPGSHRLARRRSISLADVRKEPLILPSRRVVSSLFDALMAAFNRAGVTPEIAHEPSQLHGVVGLVAAGCGIALLPSSASHLRLRGVVYRPIADRTLTAAMAVATIPSRNRPLVKHFVDLALALRPAESVR